jgi:hypothetical protein
MKKKEKDKAKRKVKKLKKLKVEEVVNKRIKIMKKMMRGAQ